MRILVTGGTGFFLIHYLKAGVDIDGSDASADMLQRCREKCRESGLRPDLYQQRLEDLDLSRRYGNIHIPDGSFSHLHDKAVAQQALSRLYEHLLPGGKLLVDAHVPLPEPPETGKWLLGRLHECDDGSTILVSTLERYEDHCRLWKRVIKYEKFVDGRLADSEMALHAIRFYDLMEFESMLAAAGFTDIRNIPREESGLPNLPTVTMSGLFVCSRPLE